MNVATFSKHKYGPELLLDLGRMEDIPYFFGEGKPHATDFYEVFFLRKATGTLRLDNQTIELEDGLIIFASPYQRRVWNISRETTNGYYLIFARDYLELLFRDALFVFRLQFFHNHQTPLYLKEDAESLALHNFAFEKILQELKTLKYDSEEIIRAYLLLILAEQNRKYCDTYGLKPEKSPNTEAFRFKKLVETHIRQYNKVDEFAQLLNLSRITLNKQVKAKFGITASQLIKNRLLTEIQRELLFSTKTIAEITYELNFSEPPHLVRFFKRYCDCTPTEYRALYQNGNHLT